MDFYADHEDTGKSYLSHTVLMIVAKISNNNLAKYAKATIFDKSFVFLPSSTGFPTIFSKKKKKILIHFT